MVERVCQERGGAAVSRVMSLWEIRAEIGAEMADGADDILLERELEAWRIVEEVTAKRAWVVGVGEDAEVLRATWAELELAGEPVVTAVVDEDWRNAYKAHFKAWRSGRLHWVPEWERVTYPLSGDDVVIWLDPGMAFGTGNHETTRLCCERLVAWAETAPRTARVIDAGCGSGILALSAVKLGFGAGYGFDNDAEAVRISAENAVLNGAGEAVEWATADLVTGLAGREAELVLANIQADVLMRFAGELLGAVVPGGLLVLSGILAHEQALVREVFAAAAPEWGIEGRVMGEWSDLALRRPV